jgi:RNA polymerase sigma-70 factor (ECF subfamily)
LERNVEEHVESRRAAWCGDLEGELPWMQELACHLVRDREAARELVQDAWLQALEKPPRERDRPRAWIGTVMRNLVRQVGRRSARRGRAVADETGLADRQPLPIHELERVELEALLREEFLRLAEPFRSTLRDHFVHGLSSAEIARRRGVPSGTVRWRVKVGLDRLRERLDEQCGGRDGWRAVILAFVPEARLSLERAGPAPRPVFVRPDLVIGAGLFLITGGALWSTLSGFDELRPGPTPIPEATAARVRDVEQEPFASVTNSPPLQAEPPVLNALSEASAVPSAMPRTVRVVDTEGTPIHLARLEVLTSTGFEERGASDEAGRVVLRLGPDEVGTSGVPAARAHHAMRASAPGFAFSEVLFVPSDWPADEPLEITLRGPAQTVRGRVLDPLHAPIAGAEVSALQDPNRLSLADPRRPFSEPWPVSTRTDEEGDFLLSGLDATHAAVCVRPPGGESQLVSREDDPNGLTLTLFDCGILEGVILDADGQPARGARVWVEPLQRGSEWCAGTPGYDPGLRGFSHETLTDGEGRYELRGLLGRTRRVYAASVEDPGHVASALVHVSLREVTRWNARLADPPGIRLRFVDPAGVPLVGWQVLFSSARFGDPRWLRRTTSDASGLVAVPEAPGPAEVTVHAPDGLGPPWLSEQVRPDADVQTFVVDERRFGMLSGRMLDEGGQVPGGAWIEACSEASQVPAPIRIDPETGRFRSRLRDGEYQLVLRSPQGGCILRRIEVRPGGQTKLGRVALPGLGQLELRADELPGRRENYRLYVCVGRTVSKWREEALPLFSSEEVFAGLYRLDANEPGGVVRSAWAEVTAGRVTELDLERLATVRVEVLAPARAPFVQLTIERPDVEADPGSAVRTLRVSRRLGERFVHTLKLQPGEWSISALADSRTGPPGRLVVGPSGTSTIVLRIGCDRLDGER